MTKGAEPYKKLKAQTLEQKTERRKPTAESQKSILNRHRYVYLMGI